MKTFLEVEGKMGQTPTPASQFRPPLPNSNPNIRKTMQQRRGKEQHQEIQIVAPSLPPHGQDVREFV